VSVNPRRRSEGERITVSVGGRFNGERLITDWEEQLKLTQLRKRTEILASYNNGPRQITETTLRGEGRKCRPIGGRRGKGALAIKKNRKNVTYWGRILGSVRDRERRASKDCSSMKERARGSSP